MFTGLAIAGGAVLGAGASIYAANKQAQSAGDAGAVAQGQYEANRAALSPWVTTGRGANTALADRLGIAPTTGPDWNAYLKANPDVAASAEFGNNPSLHYERYGRKEGRALPMLTASRGPNTGSLVKPFTMADLTNEPGYQFGLNEGEKGIDRAAGAAGGRYSGATLKALTRFNSDYAGTKYDAAFNRDAATKNQTYSFLTGASSTGVNAAGMTAGLGANSAATQAGLITDAGNARAAGTVGVANAASSGVSSYLNYNQGNAYIAALKDRAIGSGNRAYTLQDDIQV